MIGISPPVKPVTCGFVRRRLNSDGTSGRLISHRSNHSRVRRSRRAHHSSDNLAATTGSQELRRTLHAGTDARRVGETDECCRSSMASDVAQHGEPLTPGRRPRVDRPLPHCVGWAVSRAFRTQAAKPASSSIQAHTGRTCRPGMGAPTSRRHPSHRARHHQPRRHAIWTRPRWRAWFALIHGTHTTPSARGTARRRSPAAPRAEVAYAGPQDESASRLDGRTARPGLSRNKNDRITPSDVDGRRTTVSCSNAPGAAHAAVVGQVERRSGEQTLWRTAPCRGSTGVVSAAPGSFRAWAFEPRSFPARVHADERSSGDGAPT